MSSCEDITVNVEVTDVIVDEAEAVTVIVTEDGIVSDIYVDDETVEIYVNDEPIQVIIDFAEPGPQGPIGPIGPPGIGLTNLFIGPDAPVAPPDTYMWIQTEYGTPDGFTIWFEDGEP